LPLSRKKEEKLVLRWLQARTRTLIATRRTNNQLHQLALLMEILINPHLTSNNKTSINSRRLLDLTDSKLISVLKKQCRIWTGVMKGSVCLRCMIQLWQAVHARMRPPTSLVSHVDCAYACWHWFSMFRMVQLKTSLENSMLCSVSISPTSSHVTSFRPYVHISPQKKQARTCPGSTMKAHVLVVVDFTLL
jgi:hypothetical protein